MSMVGARNVREARRGTAHRIAAVSSPALVWAVLLSAVLLSAVAAGTGVLSADVAVARFVQRAPNAGAGDLARVLNALGETPMMLTLGAGAALALVARGRPGAALFLIVASLARGINPLLKAIADSPRPTTAHVRVEEVSSGWGFPSGHVMGMTLVVGAAAYLAWQATSNRTARFAVVAGAGGVLLASGFGRVYAGAHWPSDVLGAYLWGGLGVIGLVWCRRLVVDGIGWRPATAVVTVAETRMARGVVRNGWISALVLVGTLALGVALAAAQETAEGSRQAAQIRSGTCDTAESTVIFDLGPVDTDRGDDEDNERDDAPSGDVVGATGALPVAVSATQIPAALDEVLSAPHALVITAGAPDAPTISCGEIGGRLRGGDELIVGLAPRGDDGLAGVAFLKQDDGRELDITVYVVDARQGLAAPPAP